MRHHFCSFPGFKLEQKFKKNKWLNISVEDEFKYRYLKTCTRSSEGILQQEHLDKRRNFYINRNNNKVDSSETERIIIADFLPWSHLEKDMYATLF